ncbi:MAG: restriction endonuclease subunit S [Saprospiraceae bacterium]|nr:restriction endonuclease subunit S [Saprospiraceae bacterium]
MTSWKEYKLDDIAEIHNKKRVPLSSQVRSKRSGKFPYYGASGIVDYIDDYIFDGEFVLISEDGENLRSRNTPIAFKAKGKFWVNNHSHIVKGKKNYLNDWIIYYFKNLDINPYITGAVQPKLNKENLLSIPFRMPDFKTVEQIAEILSSLDDKIELNNKINQELENLAQTIFKQWFIDFEFPDENGNPYKSSSGEMVDSELGEIPKGWEVERLGDHLYIKGRIGWKGLKKSEYLQEFKGYSIVNGSDFLNEQIDYSTCGWISKERYDDSPEIQLRKNDILITKDGTIGKLAFVSKIEHPTSVASGVFVVRSNSKKVSTFFCWSFFKSPYFQHLVKSRIDGSVIPHLYQKDFVEMFIPLPPISLLQVYESQAKSIFEMIFENKEESKELGKLRDSLLPKLISGELEVAEILSEKI